MSADKQPKVLFVYYTFSQQTGRVVDAMANAATAKGYDVTKGQLEFTDPKYRKHLTGVPMKRPPLKIGTMLVPQRRRKTGVITIPQEAQDGDYDLVVFGSPTWWLTTNMPIRSYLKSPEARKIMAGKPFAAASVSRRYWKGNIKDIKKLGESNGGVWQGETQFLAAGGQVKSMLSWLAYMKHGEARERAYGLKVPPPNLKPDFEAQAKRFIDELGDRVFGRQHAGVGA